MAKLTREIYFEYAKKIVSVLSGDAFYEQYKSRVDGGASNFKLVKKRLIQDISIDWIETIEDCLPNLDNIVRNPRKFIVQEEDIVDVSLAKSISTESVKHLAQHTNMISKVDEDGMVTPSKILNITKEESFEIYENRFIYTLLLKLKDFVTMRYDKIKKASATQDVLQLNVDSKFNLPSKKITYRTEYMAQLSFDEVMQLDPETLEKVERIAKIDRIITDFLSSSFAKQMRGSAPVRPPITRTNVILKEPNFKKALTLWQFVETYEQSAGFSSSDDVENYTIEDESSLRLKNMVTLNTMLFESLYDQHETDFDMEEAQFADILKIGQMDFAPDELDHDEYSQKLDEKELEKEAEEQEEIKPPEEEKSEEEPPQEETPPEEEIREEEIEKEVDKEKETEAPPKEEPEDEEPDADKFDQNLFDVRKLYKRPEDDRLRQEEMAKIKDAIDRCLVSYRKIKQEEFEKKEREEARRKHLKELERRAEAYRIQRDKIEKEYEQQRESFVLGGNAFASQAAKIVLPSKDTDFEKEHKEIFVNKREKLDLSDADLDKIKRSIEEMERIRHKEEERRIRLSGSESEESEIEDASALPVADLEAIAKKTERTRSVNKSVRTIGSASGETSVTSKARVFEPIDESKVAVGGINLSFGGIGDLLGGTFGSQKATIIVDKRPDATPKQEPTPVKVKPAAAAAGRRYKKAGPKIGGEDRIGQSIPETADIEAPNLYSDAPEILSDTAQSAEANPPEHAVNVIEARAEESRIKVEDAPAAFTEEAQKESDNEAPDNARQSTIRLSKRSEPRSPWDISPTTLNQKYSRASGSKKDIKPVDEKKVAVGGIRLKSVEIDPFAQMDKVEIKPAKTTDSEEMDENDD